MTTTKTTKPRAKTAPTATEQTWDDLLAAIASPEPFSRDTYTTAPVVLDDTEFTAALAAADTAYRNARVEMHGDFERAHARVVPTLQPCWERPEWSALGTQPAVTEVPRHRRRDSVSVALLGRVRDRLLDLAAAGPERPEAPAVTAEAAAPLAPLPQRVPGATQSAPPLGASSGDPEWRTLPARTERAFTPRQSVPWDGAPTTIKLIPALPVAANSGPPAEGLGELDADLEPHMVAFQAAHDAEPAPDFPADPAHEERQDDEALDEAADPIPVGEWVKPGTDEGDAAE